MRENKKNLVIAYSYYIDRKDTREEELSKKIEALDASMRKEPNDEATEELMKTANLGFQLAQNKKVWVQKEYPEFLIRNFRTKKELFDFIDEDEQNIYLQSEIQFLNIPEFLENIGMYGMKFPHDDEIECKEYIDVKHRRTKEDKQSSSQF